MTPFQVLALANMTWWSVAIVFAFYLLWQRGRMNPQVSTQFTTVRDEITVEALSGNVRKTIAQYRTVGYEPTSVTSRGSIQRITLYKNVKVPKGGTR